jgi:hypothetical protein
MRGKLLFAAGIAAGYVIGARAGRPAYDAVLQRISGFTAKPPVVRGAEQAKQTLEDTAPAVADVVEQAASIAAGAAAAAREAGARASEDAPEPASSKAPSEPGA